MSGVLCETCHQDVCEHIVSVHTDTLDDLATEKEQRVKADREINKLNREIIRLNQGISSSPVGQRSSTTSMQVGPGPFGYGKRSTESTPKKEVPCPECGLYSVTTDIPCPKCGQVATPKKVPPLREAAQIAVTSMYANGLDVSAYALSLALDRDSDPKDTEKNDSGLSCK